MDRWEEEEEEEDDGYVIKFNQSMQAKENK